MISGPFLVCVQLNVLASPLLIKRRELVVQTYPQGRSIDAIQNHHYQPIPL